MSVFFPKVECTCSSGEVAIKEATKGTNTNAGDTIVCARLYHRQGVDYESPNRCDGDSFASKILVSAASSDGCTSVVSQSMKVEVRWMWH